MRNRHSMLATCVLLSAAILAGCTEDARMEEKPRAEAARPPAPPKPQALSSLVLPEPGVAIPFGESRFLTKWMLLGPFTFGENDFGGDPQTAAADKEFMPDEASLDGTQQPPAGSKATWKVNDFAGGDNPGRIDLESFYGGLEHVAAYAVAWVNCPVDIADGRLLVGSDDYVKVWINGQLVHTYKTERRPGEADQDVVTGIRLKKGLNRIVVKCVDVVLDWNFYLRFADKESRAIGVKTE